MKRLTLVIAFASTALLLAAPAHAAKLKSSVTITQSASGSRVVVSLTSSKRVAAKRKPRSVVVVAAGRKLKLSKAKAASMSAGYASSWQSKNFTGAYAAKLNALNGKRLKVTVSSRSGKSNFKPKATVLAGGGGGGGGGPRFAVPSAPLIGDAAWNHLKGYFLNSAFSDCAAGVWPACAVANRYVHCPDFSWQYRRATPSNGSDINSYYSFTVSGAEVAADGSWAVQYFTSTGGNYVWRVNQSGIASGEYSYGPTYETMPNYIWSQPAITWDRTSGAC